MSDLIKTLKQIALRKRDEKGEQGKRVSEKGFVEWKAADALEAKDKRIAELEAERDFAIDHRNTARDKVEELEADRLCRCVDEVRCELQAELIQVRGLSAFRKDENERLTAVYEAAKEYEKMFARSRTKPYSVSNELQALFDALAAVKEKIEDHRLDEAITEYYTDLRGKDDE